MLTFVKTHKKYLGMGVACLISVVGCAILSPDMPLIHDGIVCLTDGMGHGSGVVVAHQGNWWYVATAAHVADIPNLTMNGLPIEEVCREADVAIMRFRNPNGYYDVHPIGVPERGDEATAKGWLRTPDGLARADFRVRVVCPGFDGGVGFQGGVFWGMSGSGVFDDWGRVIGIVSRTSESPWGEPWAGLSVMESGEIVSRLLEQAL